MNNHEWHYYIGGACGFRDRSLRKVVARVEHTEQDVYEAVIVRRSEDSVSGYFPLGTFNNVADAINTIEKVYGYE